MATAQAGARTDPGSVQPPRPEGTFFTFVLSLRDAAFYAGQQAVVVPQVSVSSDIRSGTIPLYERAIAKAREMTSNPYVRDDPGVSLLNAAYIRVVTTELEAFSAEAEASDHPSAENKRAAQETGFAAQRALVSWRTLYASAQAGSR